MTALLDVRGLTKHFPGAGGRTLRALEDVSFTLEKGEVLGIVGESGCGKTTLGRAVLRLVEPTAGSVVFEGDDLVTLAAGAMKKRRRDLQIVFQDPFGSLNPRHKVRTLIGEPLTVHGEAGVRERVAEMLALVGLPADAGDRFPHEFSGGQRQRIAIARALSLSPKLLVADEPVSALDVSIQSQIINLIADLRKRLSLSMLFISHDLSVIRHVSDRIAVMYLGRIVEIGAAADVFERPSHPYTQALLSAVPVRPGEARRERIVLEGDLPDPSAPPPGCAFHGRCRHAMPRCAADRPELRARAVGMAEAAGAAVGLAAGHEMRDVACHLHAPAGGTSA